MEIQQIKQELERITEDFCFLGDDNDNPSSGIQVGRVLPKNADKLAKEVVALHLKLQYVDIQAQQPEAENESPRH